MSVSSITEGGTSAQTGDSSQTDISGTNLPLVLTSAYKDEQARSDGNQILHPLPSNRYKFTNWHELRLAKLRGNDLKAPRVRESPSVKERMFYTLENSQGALIHHDLKGRERRDYQNEMENWENVEMCNLSYQNLSEDFQKANFVRILRRLCRALEINIMCNMMVDLQSLSFPCCKIINMSGNHLDAFARLPRMPQVEQLILTDNNIQSLRGLEHLKKMTNLLLLDLSGNPITFLENYRQRIFQALPSLRVLDNIPRLPSDDEEFEDNESKSCSIS